MNEYQHFSYICDPVTLTFDFLSLIVSRDHDQWLTIFTIFIFTFMFLDINFMKYVAIHPDEIGRYIRP